MSNFGTYGVPMLEAQYREDYWYLNEMQIIGGLEDTPEYRAVVERMGKIVAMLGYTPES
jgi:hypothetical protein